MFFTYIDLFYVDILYVSIHFIFMFYFSGSQVDHRWSSVIIAGSSLDHRWIIAGSSTIIDGSSINSINSAFYHRCWWLVVSESAIIAYHRRSSDDHRWFPTIIDDHRRSSMICILSSMICKQIGNFAQIENFAQSFQSPYACIARSALPSIPFDRVNQELQNTFLRAVFML